MTSRSAWHRHEFSFFLIVVVLSVWAPHAHGQPPAQTPSSPQPDGIAQISDGTISGNVYHNPDLGLRYEFPKGWAVNDKKTQRDSIAAQDQLAWTEDVAPRRKAHSRRQCAKELLFVTHYPENMRTNGFNPFVLLIVADPQCIDGPTSPTSAKDQDVIQRIAANIGMYFETLNIRAIERPRIHAFENSGRVILELSARYGLTTVDPATARYFEVMTSTVVIPMGKYWLVAMFAGGDDAELDWLRATKMYFESPSLNTSEQH